MTRLIRLLLMMIWILDVINIWFMQCIDTTYPLNTMFWLLVWIFIFL